MRELSSSAFPLGETSLHLLHTPDGNMFVTADLAVKLFDSAPATFAEFVRANRYVRVNAMERAVVRLCASLGIPPETAGGDKPVPVAAAAVARDETVRGDGDPNAKGGSANATAAGPKDAVTLLPEKTVLAILEDRRAPRRAAQFRETAARRSFVAAERLARQGAFADALPLALDAVRREQDIHETPRARRAAAEAAEREASARRASSSSRSPPSGAKGNLRDETSVTNTVTNTSAPHVALFEPYLLAASITLALGKTEACDSLLGLASWIALRRGDAVSETQRARLKRTRGELRSRQGRTRDALEEFASAAVHAAEASGPQTPRVALELFKLADAFRETARAEDRGPPGPDADEARGEARDDATETETAETDAAANAAHRSPHIHPTTTRRPAISASRCDMAATRIWLAAAADALGLLPEESSARDSNAAVAAFESRLKLTFSRQSRASFADLESGQLEEASQALGRVAAREATGIDEGTRHEGDLAAMASLARGLVLFVARERNGNVALLDASDAEDEDEGDFSDRDELRESETKAPFAPTFEEAVARVAEAIAAFPPSSNGAAFARAALERWSGVDES